ncbi:hypothetical protein K2Y11_21275 [bacterium]|nr:hypothetical protein [bacterium]
MATTTIEKKEAASLESIMSTIDERSVGYEESYRQFVFDLVEGKAKLTKEAEAYVIRTGRTLDVLRADLATCHQRLAAAKQYQEAQAIKAKVDAAHQTYGKLFDAAQKFEDELEKQKQAKWDEVERFKGEMKSLELEYQELTHPANEVMAGTYDPSLDEEIETKEGELSEMRRELSLVDDAIRAHSIQVHERRRNYQERNVGRTFSEEELDAIHPRELPAHLARQKQELEKRISDTEGEINSLRASKFDLKQMKWAPVK